MNQTPFLIGFSVMALASLAIYATGKKTAPLRHHTLLHASVPFIAATAYLAMAFGIGTLVKFDGSATYFARYLDWSVTTPILLSGLVLVAFHERGRTGEVGGYLTSIIVLDVLMIVAGLISSVIDAPVVKWIWFAWSCAAFVGVLYLLWAPLRAIATQRGPALGAAYTKNVAFLTVIWFLYPIVFAVGPEGLKMISDPASVWAILVMDIIAKVVYAFYAAGNVDRALGSDAEVHAGRA
ncbi:bacteriorhodopsin [Sphingomonas sp. BAUL-RG-20F-R05-02]|uniref:bacteriorhodopsin n=1 Tax=Sphingomonas sp. BAUL-RG-20F-R05-02 TaxID=2914830 RepID=UPI001F573398|nr:bacteriorhodopsin [Sphingomonas sp. BAUL-RG-20F-R05-02]